MVILQGIVGSHAYGLNNENSDIDILGVFVNPTKTYWQLDKPVETLTGVKPDYCYHEVEKFLRMCLKCNPIVMELLWLDEYRLINPIHGKDLIDLRTCFITADHVRASYGGYAYAQFQKIVTSESTRRFKHARHCFRLLRQGKELLALGTLTLKVKDPEAYKVFETCDLEAIEKMFDSEYEEFKSIKSVLPDEPNTRAVNKYLYKTRLQHL